MSPRDGQLPSELEAIVRRVMDAAGLGTTEGAGDVARELRDHFLDGLEAGIPAEQLASRFGDPVAAGRRIARSRRRIGAGTRQWTRRRWMGPGAWLDEIRRSARRLGRAPGFTLLVVLTLALGVGANTAIFTVLDAVLIRDLPYPEPDRLVRVYEAHVDDPTPFDYVRAPLASGYRGWTDVFERVASLYTYREVGADLTDGDLPQRVGLMRVSAGYFETLGIPPARGRTFTDDESYGPGENVSSTAPIHRVAVLSHRLWSAHFDGDPSILERTIHLDGFPYQVVGVMPPGFRNPIGPRTDVWVPLDLRPGGSNGYGNYYLSTVARLRPGVSLDAARDRSQALAEGFETLNPDAEGSRPVLVPLQADVVGERRAVMLWILASAAGLVLLTACVNVANLLFARGLDRDRDLALRSALGSGRGRLMAGILVEHGLLAVAGGLGGLLLGWLGLVGLLLLAPEALPAPVSVQMGGTVFVFALAVTTVALGVFGLLPALRLSRAAPAEVLRSGDRSATVGRTVRRLRDGGVVVQVAAALVLVTGSMLLARSFGRLLAQPLGIEPAGVLTFEVHLPGARYGEGEARDRFHTQLQRRLGTLPEVTAAGATSWLPVNGPYHTWGFNRIEDDGQVQGAWHSTDVRIFTGDVFQVLGIELLRGRAPDQVDLAGEPMAWINRQVAEQVFGDEDPLGRQVRLAGGPRRIMGVVEDIPEDARGTLSRKAYVPHVQYADNRNWALIQTVRARGDLGAVLDRVRGELAALDPLLVLHRPRTMTGVLSGVRAQDRFATALMGAFAVLALLLSLVGTYGVLAGSVARRTREIGIRVALGADRASLSRMVFRSAATLTLPGLVLGLVVAWGASRGIRSLLFDVDPLDPLTYGLAVVLFLAVGGVSGWIPARRATRVDPVRALTTD